MIINYRINIKNESYAKPLEFIKQKKTQYSTPFYVNLVHMSRLSDHKYLHYIER
jgi:20S proteasome alpha/beta subunit